MKKLSRRSTREIRQPGTSTDGEHQAVRTGRLMKFVIAAFIVLHIPGAGNAQDATIKVPIDSLRTRFVLVGQLGKKMGTTLTVRGIVIERHEKGYSNGPNLIVQAIGDSFIQRFIRIPLIPFRGTLDNKFKKGSTYRLRVYETGQFIGTPRDVFQEPGYYFQTTGFYFQNKLAVISAEKIDPVVPSPASFVGQYALLSGVAKNDGDTALIQAATWTLRLIGLKKWSATEIGKRAEVYGKIRRTGVPDRYDVENGRAQLVNLGDQLGKMVRLRGWAINMNQYWWFEYRGIYIYVENMSGLPGWSVENHFRPMEISGVLGQEELPDIEQLSNKLNPDRKLNYIIRNASWTPIPELLAPELNIQ